MCSTCTFNNNYFICSAHTILIRQKKIWIRCDQSLSFHQPHDQKKQRALGRRMGFIWKSTWLITHFRKESQTSSLQTIRHFHWYYSIIISYSVSTKLCIFHWITVCRKWAFHGDLLLTITLWIAERTVSCAWATPLNKSNTTSKSSIRWWVWF